LKLGCGARREGSKDYWGEGNIIVLGQLQKRRVRVWPMKGNPEGAPRL